MSKLDRLIEIYLMLPTPPRSMPVSAIVSRLQQHSPDFNVSIRTVQRDLAFLQGSRTLGIDTDNRRPGAGWYRDPHTAFLIRPSRTTHVEPVQASL